MISVLNKGIEVSFRLALIDFDDILPDNPTCSNVQVTRHGELRPKVQRIPTPTPLLSFPSIPPLGRLPNHVLPTRKSYAYLGSHPYELYLHDGRHCPFQRRIDPNRRVHYQEVGAGSAEQIREFLLGGEVSGNISLEAW